MSRATKRHPSIAATPNRSATKPTTCREPATHQRNPIFMTNLGLIESSIAAVSVRAGLFGVDREDFRSWVMYRLLRDDCSILLRFEGRGEIAGYIRAVVRNLLRDHRNAVWGKWRPSARGVRLGAHAVEIERLTVRDGLTVGEAIAHLAARGPWAFDELNRVASLLRLRPGRRMVGQDVLDTLPDPFLADRRLIESERFKRARDVSAKLAAALETLPRTEQALVRMHFLSGLTVAEVARRIRLPQKRSYVTLARALRSLRQQLEFTGVSPEDVREILAAD